ncbi:glutamyl-tRNA reductase [Candidatus Methanoplasma termitum]|uniref:Glutamyl-tRNA reductase n=1 Tax=Candidatus Methanoplasma termitum TaxID=1577791 RepID=A0A0A7LGJ8_9ARCH|nr:glutamyl-tRNA reductase [Candidatus Methanoplasma termitum]AIZ56591.1 glutamyl-tRNA reductase [Candidatus Methanoplasma termitum]MCL2333839.1 glutamyl-tRNA reductase [Candidatus Methanoplasma sp.]
MIISLHVTHSCAGVEAMSNIAQVMESNIPKYLVSTTRENEYVMLKTCNRFEIYVGTDNVETVRKELESFVQNTVPRSKEQNIPFILQGKESIRHLFRVSCGLDSLIVGEDQIQGQVRDAYVRAKVEGHVSKYLSKLFDRALALGKRVRAKTRISDCSLSVGSAAVELAEKRVGGLKDKTITIIGAGSVATTIAKALMDKGTSAIFLSSRTFNRASELAIMTGGTAFSLDYLPSAIADSDVMFVATKAPHPLIFPETIRSAGNRRRPLLIVDVSVPKNVDSSVGEIPGISLESMDGLQGVAAENMMKRMSEITEAERIVSEEIAKMDVDHLTEKADNIIGEISRKAAAIREEELLRAKKRAVTADIDEVFEDMSRAIVSKLLFDAYEQLRNSSVNGEYDIIDAAKYLFGLEVK